MEDVYIQLGKQLRIIRKSKRITQEEISEKLHLSRPSISNMEKGKHKIQLHTLFEFAQVLDISVVELVKNIYYFKAFR